MFIVREASHLVLTRIRLNAKISDATCCPRGMFYLRISTGDEINAITSDLEYYAPANTTTGNSHRASLSLRPCVFLQRKSRPIDASLMNNFCKPVFSNNTYNT